MPGAVLPARACRCARRAAPRAGAAARRRCSTRSSTCAAGRSPIPRRAPGGAAPDRADFPRRRRCGRTATGSRTGSRVRSSWAALLDGQRGEGHLDEAVRVSERFMGGCVGARLGGGSARRDDEHRGPVGEPKQPLEQAATLSVERLDVLDREHDRSGPASASSHARPPASFAAASSAGGGCPAQREQLREGGTAARRVVAGRSEPRATPDGIVLAHLEPAAQDIDERPIGNVDAGGGTRPQCRRRVLPLSPAAPRAAGSCRSRPRR